MTHSILVPTRTYACMHMNMTTSVQSFHAPSEQRFQHEKVKVEGGEEKKAGTRIDSSRCASVYICACAGVQVWAGVGRCGRAGEPQSKATPLLDRGGPPPLRSTGT